MDTRYLVQFVGFKTTQAETDFISNWSPVASIFKRQGIRSIDLYRIANPLDLTYISRNIWEEQTYFHNFPTGLAGTGGGGGISVIQFGAYRIPPEHLERQDKMRLLFLQDTFTQNDDHTILLPSSTAHGPFKEVLIINDDRKLDLQAPAIDLVCKHIKHL